MYTPLDKITLKELIEKPIMVDANILMVGIENRGRDPNCSFTEMRDLYLIPFFESFKEVIIHKAVYDELDSECKHFIDRCTNVVIVECDNLYGVDPLYTTIFNNIAQHERIAYKIGSSKDRGEVYSLAYAAFNKINYFSSKEIKVDDIVNIIPDLEDISVITFDVIVLLAYIYHNSGYVTKYNKALKSVYKRYCEDVIKRHKLPPKLSEYFTASMKYISSMLPNQ